MATICQEYIDEFRENGFVMVSGLIDDEVICAAERKLEIMTEGDRLVSGAGSILHSHHKSDELLNCFNPSVQEWATCLSSSTTLLPKPAQLRAIIVFPESGEWHWNRPHIDNAGPEENRAVFPAPIHIMSTVYLNDVAPHSGGSVFWPRSHWVLETTAKTNPPAYQTMFALDQAIERLDFDEPVELNPRSGDVLFYHYLSVHAGSKNLGNQTRMVLNAAW